MLKDALAATKLLHEGSVRTVGEARTLAAASGRARSGRPLLQCRLRHAIGQQRQPSARSREQCSSEVAAALATAAAAAAERVTPVTLLKEQSVSGQIGQF